MLEYFNRRIQQSLGHNFGRAVGSRCRLTTATRMAASGVDDGMVLTYLLAIQTDKTMPDPLATT